MKLNKLIIAFLFVFVGITSAQQQGDYSKEPGYFDFGDMTLLKDGEMLTEVYLEEPLLKMVAKMGESKGEGLGDMIGALKLVKVNEFMVARKNFGKLEDAFAELDKNLQAKKWIRIIKTKQHNTSANVYVKNGSDDDFVGVLVAATDKEGKVTLVNIVGKINPDNLGKLSTQFNFPGVGKMKEKEKEDK